MSMLCKYLAFINLHRLHIKTYVLQTEDAPPSSSSAVLLAMALSIYMHRVE